MGAIAGGGVALAFARTRVAAGAAADARRGHARRHGVGGDPGVAAHALQRQRDPDVADARLRRARSCCRCSCTARGGIRRASTSRSRRSSPTARCCRSCSTETRLNVGFLDRARGVAAGWLFMRKSFVGFQMRVAGLAPAAARYAGLLREAHGLARHAGRRRVRRARRHRRSGGTDRPAAADQSRPATASRRSSSRSSAGCIRSASCSRAC